MLDRKFFSGTALKRLACILMLIDHAAAIFLADIYYIPFYYLNYFQMYACAEMPLALLIIKSIMRGVGRLAFPIFAFLLVEGFIYSKHRSKYFLRLTLFGIISEPFFDFAFYGSWFDLSHQSIYFTLALGFIAMEIIKRLEELSSSDDFIKQIGLFVLFTLTAFAGYAFNVDYSVAGVLLITGIYAFRTFPLLQGSSFTLFTAYQFPATLAMIPISAYNGTRGQCSKLEQLGHYIFYPAHLLVLGLISTYLF